MSYTILWTMHGREHVSPCVFDSIQDAEQHLERVEQTKHGLTHWKICELNPVKEKVEEEEFTL